MNNVYLTTTKHSKLSGSQVALLVLACATLLVIVSWMTVWATADDICMSKERWIALGFGALFSLPIGCGLVALMFYSSRHGHDEAATPKFRNGGT